MVVQKLTVYKIVAFIFCLFFVNSTFAKDLVMTAPPRETPIAGNTLYGPLAAAFTKILGVKVNYIHPRNWLRYQRNMRNGDYDIVFDGPHFASWRIHNLGHVALVKLPGTLEFFLVSKKADTKIQTPDSLIRKKICGISPPNLSTLSILARYNNPIRQPTVVGVTGGMKKVYKQFRKGVCRAAVFRTDFYYKKISKTQRSKYNILYHSVPLPNQVITVSQRISKIQRKRLRSSIINGIAKKPAKPIVKRFGGNAKSFVRAETKEYQGPGILLQGVIFGW